MIDTAQGFPAWIESLKTVLASENAIITKALITHFHHDHIGGIADLRAISPSTVFYKYSPDEGQVAIEDGMDFSVEGANLMAVYTPGHAPDHVCFVLMEENALFTGDNVLGHGTTVFTDLKDYMDSLHRMGELRPGRAYPAHGQLIEDGLGKIEEYIKHRKAREAQIVRTLEALRKERPGPEGAVTSMDIVKRVYVDVDPALYLAAEVGVVQVLEKLEKEGRVATVVVEGKKKWYILSQEETEAAERVERARYAGEEAVLKEKLREVAE